MTSQLNLTQQNTALNWSKLWLYSKVFLVFLIAITLLPSLGITPLAFYISNILLFLLFAITILIVKFKRKQIPFIKIEENNLYYFCPVKKESVMIPADEIIKVTTQFCELYIHTINGIHRLNMNKIKQEKQRWEIKETIKNLATNNNKQASGF